MAAPRHGYEPYTDDEAWLSQVAAEAEAAAPVIDLDRTPVGDALRLTRLHHGQELGDVAAALRIRRVHLEAMEAGDWQNLPGTAYAVGFIRSYGGYLGLDAELLVQRYKREVALGPIRPQLNFPHPPGESRVPGGAIMLLALILTVLVYGGWYWAASTEKPLAELIPQVPEQLRAWFTGEPTPAPPAPAPSAPRRTQFAPALAPASTPAPSGPRAAEPASAAMTGTGRAPAADGTADSSLAGSTLSGPAPAGPAPGPSASEAPAPGTALRDTAARDTLAPDAPAPGTTSSDIPGSGAVPSGTAASLALDGAPGEGAPATGLDENALPLPPQPRPVPPEAGGPALSALEDLPQGRVFGERAASRIVLQATATSWVRVRDGGRILFEDTLREGDIYFVPDRAGLELRTGNAGGLRAVVGEVLIPALGELASTATIRLNEQDLVARQP